MSLAANDGVRFIAVQREESWTSEAGEFMPFDDQDNQIVSDWLERVRMRGIDAVIDFSVRPWGIADAGGIFGVFRAHSDHAAWLMVRQESGWTVARCADGVVSDGPMALRDALAMIDTDI